MFHFPIALTTQSDMKEFVEIASSIKSDVYVKSGKLVGNAKSLLNVLATIEWDDLTVESDEDISSKFIKFMKE